MVLAAGQIAWADPSKANNNNSLTSEVAFSKTVQPFLSSYCVGCHNSKTKTANLDLQQFTSVEAVRANLKVWKKVAWKLEEREMPPAKTPQPKAAAHRAMLKWVKAELEKADTTKR
jgi:hypothetical protein